MAKLIISRDAHILREVELGVGRTTIGRHPYNDVVLAHPAASAHHAAVTCGSTGAALEDLGSSNGSFVNGKRVTHAALADRDRVAIAGFQIEYLAGHPAPAAEGSIEVLNGANAGKRMSLVKPITTLGSPGVLVVVISRQVDGYYMARVQGEAVALLNEQATGTAPSLLRDGDLLELTGTRMRFSAKFC
ncbi:MAG: phosphopeptide-binding protein [Massilia sp.]|nr:phosphopeptide-binding protein [Massilia sp.]MDB5950525.1 phosphopeptide-binding protein [Massilia sp.]